MNSIEIRKSFLDFFESKKHKIIQSAPMVVKDDPTLMFTNAGMNQFKDIFLGNKKSDSSRIADSQKCLRVSGKHNDLGEVGHDTYHHTMFEMLGNWSFGDYFKNEAIDWAWEYLTGVLKIDKSKLYVTVFEGSKKDGTKADEEAKNFWKKYLPEDKILYGNKKDNFWEMGESGPCGPCSEIHIDLRDENEITKIKGAELVNKDHPLVIEIWNLVFIQYNRKKSGELENLPAKHVDTGMGFERLCMVVQNKKSNYDTDVFQLLINKISKITSKEYGKDIDTDIAMRVIADHLRAVAFSITDGQLPSNTGAGYVIRRILRRAVRYGYTFLKMHEPFIYKLLGTLIKIMGDAYPELSSQKDIIEKVIMEEEHSFLRTLENGIKLLDKLMCEAKKNNIKEINGNDAFVLYDTFGFPFDLTELILRENNFAIDKKGFDFAMNQQKSRSKEAANEEKEDWTIIFEDDTEEFIGYDHNEAEVKITRYRKVQDKKKTYYHIVFNYTPFYAESGGQVGDTGYIESNNEKIEIIDTQKEHNVIIHISEKLPENLNFKFKAVVNNEKRELTMSNHSATHLMHKALRNILGNHVEQKGSLVDYKHLRFDFSHFQKLSNEEIAAVEKEVNRKIRQNYMLEENRAIPMNEALEQGATALFGEKYGELVRVIKFGDSIELCGGMHVSATGNIGIFKIISESAIAAGIRRIEAVTSTGAENFINSQINTVNDIKSIFKNTKNLKDSVLKLQEENRNLKKEIENLEKEKLKDIKDSLISKILTKNGINILSEKINIKNAGFLRDLLFQINNEKGNLFAVIGAEVNGKANISVMISENLIKELQLNAGKIIKDISKEINGGGGGQANFASAGGSNPDGIEKALKLAEKYIV